MIRPQRTGTVATSVVQPHQPPVGVLAQRIGAQQAFGIADRIAVLAALPPASRRAAPARRSDGRAAARARRAPSRRRRPGAGRRRRASTAPRKRLAFERVLERRDVELQRRVRAPAQRAGRHLEVAVGVGERVPERVEDVPQVRPRLRLGRVGPEQERELRARLRRLAGAAAGRRAATPPARSRAEAATSRPTRRLSSPRSPTRRTGGSTAASLRRVTCSRQLRDRRRPA